MLETHEDENFMSHDAEPKPRRTSGANLEALTLYLREVQAIPLLTPAAEKELGKRIRAGDSSAVDELVRHNLRFVVMVARRYARVEAPLEDLVNEGNLGLIHAAERFDYRRGFRFVSYAVWWIRQAILAYLSEKTRTVRLPIGKAQLLSRLTQTSDRLAQQLGHEPTADEIGRRMHLPPEKVEWLRSLPNYTLSLDVSSAGEDTEFEMDTLQDTTSATIDELLEEAVRADDLRAALDRIEPREADIVRRYYGLGGAVPEPLTTIGRRHGITRERARQLRDRAIEKLRNSQDMQQLIEYV